MTGPGPPRRQAATGGSSGGVIATEEAKRNNCSHVRAYSGSHHRRGTTANALHLAVAASLHSLPLRYLCFHVQLRRVPCLQNLPFRESWHLLTQARARGLCPLRRRSSPPF